MTTQAPPTAPQVTIERIVAAEVELNEGLGVLTLFGVDPRARHEVDYRARLRFRDQVTVTLWIDEVGRSSLRYAFTVRRGNEVAWRYPLADRGLRLVYMSYF